MEYPERITEWLRRDGWYPGRVDESVDWEKAYQAIGRTPAECVLSFHREFNNLVLQRPTKWTIGWHDRWWIPWPRPGRFRPFASFSAEPGYAQSDLLYFVPLAGPVYDVGDLGTEGGWSLMIGESGQFVCFDGYCDCLFLVAENTCGLLDFIYGNVETNERPTYLESQVLGKVPNACFATLGAGTLPHRKKPRT